MHKREFFLCFLQEVYELLVEEEFDRSGLEHRSYDLEDLGVCKESSHEKRGEQKKRDKIMSAEEAYQVDIRNEEYRRKKEGDCG